MPFAAGEVLPSGVIVGQMPPGQALNEWGDALAGIISTLRWHHNVRVTIPPDAFRFSEELQRGQSTKEYRYEHGSLVFIPSGSGFVTAGRQQSLQVGDWAYIPAGVGFTFTAGIARSPRFRFVFVVAGDMQEV